MTTTIVEDTALYETTAAGIYAAFGAMPNSSAAVDNWNALQSVARAVRGQSGVRVVELGCGAGVRTKTIATMPEVEAALGLDYSEEQLARARYGPQPDNCRFAYGDLIALGRGERDWAAGGVNLDNADLDRQLGTFDVALMEFVTCHAGTQEDLDAMLRAASAFLRPGGQLIVVDSHPRLTRAPHPPAESYALAKTFLLPPERTVVPSFTKMRTTFITPAGTLSVEDYFHDVDSWETAVSRAGLGGLTIDDVVAPPHPQPDFWDGYIKPDHPSGCAQAAVIRAIKKH